MQKQTFEQIKEMQDRIKRWRELDRWRMGAIIIIFINGYSMNLNVILPFKN